MADDPELSQNAVDPSVQERAINEAAGYVRDTIKHFRDGERKGILERALRELGSKLSVGESS